MNKSDPLETIVSSILKKKKYDQINAGLVRSIAKKELTNRGNLKEAQKATTSKLHQIGSAYFQQKIDYVNFKARLAALPRDIQAPALRQFCLKVMAVHTSSLERLDILDIFFRETLQSLSPVQSVWDLACGLNPFALSWMPLAEQATYTAYDIYCDVCGFVQLFFDHTRRNGKALCLNVLDNIPQQEVQVAFILKSLPCLEQIEKNIGRPLLEKIPAKYILVSYPIHSLGGKSKGMRKNYVAQFEQTIANTQWKVTRFDFVTELAFLIEK